MVVIVTGAHKALAVETAVEGGVSHMCTLSCLQQHPQSMIVADEDATLELKVKTVKVGVPQTVASGRWANVRFQYFTSIERPTLPLARRPVGLPPHNRIRIPSTPSKLQFEKSPDDEIGELTPDSMIQRNTCYPSP